LKQTDKLISHTIGLFLTFLKKKEGFLLSCVGMGSC